MTNFWLNKFWDEKTKYNPLSRKQNIAKWSCTYEGFYIATLEVYFDHYGQWNVTSKERRDNGEWLLPWPDLAFVDYVDLDDAENWAIKIAKRFLNTRKSYSSGGNTLCEVCHLPSNGAEWFHHGWNSNGVRLCNECKRYNRISYRRLLGRFCNLRYGTMWLEAMPVGARNGGEEYEKILKNFQKCKMPTLDFYGVTVDDFDCHVSYRESTGAFSATVMALDY